MSFSCLDIAKAALGQLKKQSGHEHYYTCPNHNDEHPSLQINIQKNCWLCAPCDASGNPWELAAFLAGFDPSDKGSIVPWLREHHLLDGSSNNDQPVLVSEYIYQNTDGTPARKVLRYVPKAFRQQGWNGTEWDWKASKPKLLYHLPELLASPERWVVLCEGERDCDKLISLGFLATCNPGGAEKWDPSYTKTLKARSVAILPDNDPPGHAHAVKVARALFKAGCQIRVVELPGLKEKGDVSDWLTQGHTYEEFKAVILKTPVLDETALNELEARWINETQQKSQKNKSITASWKLWDLGDVEDWPAPPLEWIVEPLIPKGGIGFLSGAPKDGKSLLAVDLSIHIAHSVSVGREWLGKFPCSKAKVLYIAREDPIRRIRERAIEITNSYNLSVPPCDSIYFLIRERFNLMDDSHISWLCDQVQRNGIDFLILDVLNRMVPELDELSAKDMARMVSVIEELNRELDLTILLIDHTRKPIGPGSARNKQEPNPFDLKGSVAKYGAADFMICMSRDAQDGRLHVYSENKDTDERPHFLIDVSPKGSREPKFTYAGSIDQLSSDMRAVGIANREKVFEALEEGRWLSPAEIVSQTNLGSSTVREHLKTLKNEGRAQKSGQTRNAKWSKVIAEVVQGSFSDNTWKQ